MSWPVSAPTSNTILQDLLMNSLSETKRNQAGLDPSNNILQQLSIDEYLHMILMNSNQLPKANPMNSDQSNNLLPQVAYSANASPSTHASVPFWSSPSGGVDRLEKEEGVTLPTILHTLLADSSISGVLSWFPNGKTWKIHNANVFEQLLLRPFFESFVTPLNMSAFFDMLKEWGFQVVSVDHNSVAFAAECFVRDAPLLSLSMTRTTKEQKATATASLQALFEQQQATQARCAAEVLFLIENNIPVDLEIASQLVNFNPSNYPSNYPSALPSNNNIVPDGKSLLKTASSMPTKNQSVVSNKPHMVHKVAEKASKMDAEKPASAKPEKPGKQEENAAYGEPSQEDELAVAMWLVSQKRGPTTKGVNMETLVDKQVSRDNLAFAKKDDAKGNETNSLTSSSISSSTRGTSSSEHSMQPHKREMPKNKRPAPKGPPRTTSTKKGRQSTYTPQKA